MVSLPRPPVLTMTAVDCLLLHWPVDADALRPRLPSSLTLATFEGEAWLSVVAFRATGLRPRGLPARFGREFPEIRLQTYVRHRGTPGRFFFSIDAGDRLVANLFRLTSRMPYIAADAAVERVGDVVRVTSERAQGGTPPATLAVEAVVDDAEGDSLADRERDRWFAGHHRVFGAAGGTLWALEIDRELPELRLADVDVAENTLFEAAGLPSPTADSVARYTPVWPMHASLPWWVGA